MPDPTPAKRAGRAIAYPVLRLLEPRFADVVRRLTDIRAAISAEAETTRTMVAGYAASSSESLTFVGTQLRELTDELRAITDGAEAAPPEPGPAPPAIAGFAEGFALRALAALAPPAHVLDVRGAESPLALVLATLGFVVTCLDERPHVREHPGLHPHATTLDQLTPEPEPYAAALCLSGLDGDAGAPDRWEADAASLAHLRTLLAPDGLVVLALPAGEGEYDEPRLDALLADWRIAERIYLREQLPGTWTPGDAPEGRSAALVAATAA